jgi:hypothetical protein
VEVNMPRPVIGVLSSLDDGAEAAMWRVRRLGFAATQIACWDTTQYAPEYAGLLRAAAEP